MCACRISQWITDWVMEKYEEMTGNKTQSIYLNDGLRRLLRNGFGVFFWDNIGGLGSFIVDYENIPSIQLPNDHFDIFRQAAIRETGIGAVPGYELLDKSLQGILAQPVMWDNYPFLRMNYHIKNQIVMMIK
jgi:hypothetical protein